MHTHTYIQRTSRVATSVLSGRLVLAKVQADQKKRIITGSEYSSPPPSQTRFCRKATPLACKRNTLDKKTSLNISFGTRGSIIWKLTKFCKFCDFCNFCAEFSIIDPLVPKDMFRLVFLWSLCFLHARGWRFSRRTVWEENGELCRLPVINRFFSVPRKQ